MTVTWDRFYPYVQPHVPGCPEIVIDQHLQEAAADFCARSGIWRYDISEDFTVAGLSDYIIDVPTGAVLEDITDLYVDGFLMGRVSDLNFKYTPNLQNTKPVHYSQYLDQQVRFYPTPNNTYSFSGSCVLKPKLTATGIEDFIFETHGRTIASGAIASLAVIPGKEWTNPQLAGYYDAKFKKGADDAKGRDARRANVRVTSVNFA